MSGYSYVTEIIESAAGRHCEVAKSTKKQNLLYLCYSDIVSDR